MTAKEYLCRARVINIEINSKLETVASLRALAEKCTLSLQQAPSGGGNSRMLEDICIRICLEEKEIDSGIDELLETKDEISAAIAKLSSPLQRALLSMRYISFMSWQDISDSLNYSPSHVFRIHVNALKEMEKIINYESE